MISWQYPLSVRTPLIASISLILVVGFLTTNLISYQVSKKSLRDALIGNELPLTSNNIYSEIQRDLLQPVFVSSLMANDTFVQDWLTHGESDPAQITRYLDEIRTQYGFFTAFLISDRTRNYYHFSGISQVIDEADPRDVWYFRVRDMEQPHEINVDFNAEQGDALTVFINYKVFGKDGEYLAATGVGLKFNAVADIISRYREHFGRNVYFVDDSGKVMVRSDGAVVHEENVFTAPGMSAIAKDMMAQDQGHYEYERDGETMLVSARYIPELKWRVVVEQSEADALAGIRQSLMTNAMVGLAVIGLTLVIVMLTVNKFHARLESMAATDKLTGVGNRSVFDHTLNQALRRLARDAKPFSVILADIDHFKRVNDTYGHLEGDKVLKRMTALVGGAIRDADVLCRWGGEELIILAHDCDASNAVKMAEKVRQTVEQAAVATLDDGTPVTVSLGVSEARADDDADAILRRVDGALYEAKQGGRNRVCRA